MSNSVLEHRGFRGSIEISLDDGIIFGKVLFIEGLISYSGETLSELTQQFCEAVDEYIASCEKRGVEPQKPFSGTFNVRVGSELHKQASIVANTKGISLNEFSRSAFECYLDVCNRPVKQSNEDSVVMKLNELLHEVVTLKPVDTYSELQSVVGSSIATDPSFSIKKQLVRH
jgi:predicted HicB family RNase H-like nuclease